MTTPRVAGCEVYFARRYKSPREGALSDKQEQTRSVAYALKQGNRAAVNLAAEEMADLVYGNDILVPIPDSKGDTSANLALARAIARRTGAKVCDALRRTGPVESARARRKKGKPPLPPALQRLYRRKDCPDGALLLVDNVVTRGTTAAAAAIAMSKKCLVAVWAYHSTG